MPQRWQRELQRLSSLDTPASLRSRLASGPHGDGMPPSSGRAQRFLAGVVALAVFAGALVFAVSAFGQKGQLPQASSGPAPVTFTFDIQPSGGGADYPAATMQLGGQTVDGVLPHAEWPLVEIDLDAPDLHHRVEVPASAPIEIAGTATSVDGWVDSCCDDSLPPPRLRQLDLVQGDTVPDQEGPFVLEFVAHWPDGHQTFLFPINVVEPVPSPTPSDDASLIVTLNRPNDGSVPALSLSDRRSTKDYPGAGRWLGDPVAVVSMLFTFDRAIGPAGSIQLETDAERVELHASASRTEGGWADPVPLAISSGRAVLPDDPGAYLLIVDAWWPDGHLGYSVAITIGHPSAPSESPLPDVKEGVVPDVVGLGSGDAEKLLSLAGFDTRITYVPTSNASAGTVVASDPAAGENGGAGMVVRLTVSGTSEPLDGFLTSLACTDVDMMPFDSSASVFGDAETMIRGSIEGILPTDRVNQFRFDNGVQPMGLWEIARAGDVVAVVHLPSTEGIACRGSGIGGV